MPAQSSLAPATATNLQFLLAAKPPELVLVHQDAMTIQHDVDPLVAEPRPLRRNRLHRFAQLSIIQSGAGITHRRPVDVQSMARPTLAHSMRLACMRSACECLPLRVGCHNIFSAISFRTAAAHQDVEDDIDGVDALTERLGLGRLDRQQPVGQDSGEDIRHLPVVVVGALELAPDLLHIRREHTVAERCIIVQRSRFSRQN